MEDLAKLKEYLLMIHPIRKSGGQKEEFRKLAEKANISKEVTVLDRNNYVRLNPWGILDKKNWKD